MHDAPEIQEKADGLNPNGAVRPADIEKVVEEIRQSIESMKADIARLQEQMGVLWERDDPDY